MPSNIEIKARLENQERRLRASSIALFETESNTVDLLSQTDTFFHVPNGRLKLRQEEGLEAKLISYSRPDGIGPRLSVFHIAPVSDPVSMIKVLKSSLGISVVVNKKRELYMLSCSQTGLRTRVHIDSVDGLGDFIEFEVIIPSEEQEEAGRELAQRLMQTFEVRPEDLMESAYADYLLGMQRTADDATKESDD